MNVTNLQKIQADLQGFNNFEGLNLPKNTFWVSSYNVLFLTKSPTIFAESNESGIPPPG
ncbi:MAG: hypothetical protein OHK0038_20910 [Flammeovirgaceae bacterium]